MKISPWFILIALMSLMLAFGAFGCGCDDDDDDDSGGDDDVTDDDDDVSDDDTTDDDDDNPFEDIPIDQTFTFDNLSGPVEVILTEHGIPHIYASNEEDLMFVFGYVTAVYRLFQMDFLRHLTTGRLTEYLYPAAGEDVLYADLAMRTRFLSTNGELVFERIVDEVLSNEEKERYGYFADGVNAYLNDILTLNHGAILPAIYSPSLVGMSGVTAEDIPEWTLYDTMAIVRYQQWDLSSSLGDEVRNSLMAAALPANELEDVLRFAPIEDTAVLPGFYDTKGANAGSSPPLIPDYIKEADAERFRTAFRNLPEDVLARMENLDFGSNNWVIKGDHTSSGNAIMCNDTHLSMTNPSIFMEVHIDTKVFGDGDGTFSAYGMAFPGIPGLPIGMNEYIAWGATMAGYDVEDVYLETLDNADPALATSVTYNGGQVDIEYSTQEFKLGPKDDSEVQEIDIPYVPHHGPFLYGSVEDSGGMTNKWTGHEPTNDLPTFYDMLKAKNVDDFMTAMTQFKVGAQNFVAIDMDGNIAYFPHASVPIRDDGATPYLPMPGEGDFEWTGVIASEDLPQAKNPEKGYVITANNDMVGNLLDNDPLNDEYYLFWDRLGGAFRSYRITDLIVDQIESKGTVDVAFLQSVQADTFAREAERFLPHLLQAGADHPAEVTALGLDDALTRLAAWDFSTPIGVEDVAGNAPAQDEIDNSVAATLFYLWWTRMPYAVFNDEWDDEGTIAYDAPLPKRDPGLYYIIENPTTSATGETLFDDNDTVAVEERWEIYLQTLADAIAWAESADGFDTTDMDLWNWGKIHMTQWNDFFASFDESVAFDIKGPYPCDGADYTVDVAGSRGFYINGDDQPDYRFISTSGPSIRFVVEATPDGLVGKNILPGGESGRIESEYYNDMAEKYLTNQTHDIKFSVTDVVDDAVERWVFKP